MDAVTKEADDSVVVVNKRYSWSVCKLNLAACNLAFEADEEEKESFNLHFAVRVRWHFRSSFHSAMMKRDRH